MYMSQIIQIAREKNLGNFPNKDRVKNNQGSIFGHGLISQDMIGLSWIFLDDSVLHLANPERRCKVIE